MSETPVFGNVAAFYKVGTGPVHTTEARYEWGGNHHNDQLKFVYETITYDIWHSSIGFGGRVCAPPDCLLACYPDTTFDACDAYSGWAVDGCARDPHTGPPPAPVICVVVNADGTVPALADPWTSVPPLLPCAGDQ
jgi:hypothetical protein